MKQRSKPITSYGSAAKAPVAILPESIQRKDGSDTLLSTEPALIFGETLVNKKTNFSFNPDPVDVRIDVENVDGVS